MKRIIPISLAILLVAGCKNNNEKGRFTLNANIANLPEQKVLLEEIYMTQRDPEVLDTAEVKNGKFTLSALAPEEGLFRLRLPKAEKTLVFVNDVPELSLTADANNLTMNTVQFNSPANAALKSFITSTEEQLTQLEAKGSTLQQFTKDKQQDSAYIALRKEHEQLNTAYSNYLINFIDTCRSPVVSLFALSYTRDIEPKQLEKPIASLAKRFPNNSNVTMVIGQFKQMMAAATQQQQPAQAIPGPGDQAPDITMPDTEGKQFSLSSLRGKYVLVDFWASWCGPCRAENPNVVAAFNKYKNKNFTVLGVSLDKNKAAWLDAIKTDGLAWKHISDLQQWSSAAVSLYGFEGIPYNALIDPQGKIIATSLRGEDLEAKLAEVLK